MIASLRRQVSKPDVFNQLITLACLDRIQGGGNCLSNSLLLLQRCFATGCIAAAAMSGATMQFSLSESLGTLKNLN